MTYFLPAADQVEVIVQDHTPKFGYFIRAVLHIRIHGDHDLAFRGFKAFVEGGRLAIIALEPYAFDTGIAASQFINDLPGIVRAAIIYEDDLTGKVILLYHAVDPAA